MANSKKKFDKKSYDKQYQRENYKKIGLCLKFDEYEQLQHFMDFENVNNLSQNRYIINCVIKCINDGYKG